MKYFFILFLLLATSVTAETFTYNLNISQLPYTSNISLSLIAPENSTSIVAYNSSFIYGDLLINYFNFTAATLNVSINVPATPVGFYNTTLVINNNVSNTSEFHYVIFNITNKSIAINPLVPILLDINKFKYMQQCVWKQPYDLLTDISLSSELVGKTINWNSSLNITQPGSVVVTQNQHVVTLVSRLSNLTPATYTDIITFYSIYDNITITNTSSQLSIIFEVSNSGTCAKPVFSKENCVNDCKSRYNNITTENYKGYASCLDDCARQEFLEVENANNTIYITNESERIIIQEKYQPVIPVDSADKIVNYQSLSDNYNKLSGDVSTKITDISGKVDSSAQKIDDLNTKILSILEFPEIKERLANETLENEALSKSTISIKIFILFIIALSITGFVFYFRFKWARNMPF